LVVEIDVSVNSTVLVVLGCQSWEKSVLQLASNVVSCSKSSSSDWDSHPRLTEEWVTLSSSILERSCFVGEEPSKSNVESDLSSLQSMIFMELLSVGSVITEFFLEPLDLHLSGSQILVLDVSKVLFDP